jgi:histone H3/H4
MSTPNNSAPAAAPAPSTGASASVDLPEIPTTDDLFSAYERSIGMTDKIPDYSEAKETREGTMEDLLDIESENTEDPLTGESEEGEATGEEGTASETEQSSEDLIDSVKEDKTDKPLYEFKGKIGEKERQLTIKTPEQMDRVIKRALVAEELYARNQEKDQLISQYEGQAKAMDRLDELIEKDPFHVVRSIIEDLPEDQLKNWLVEMADWVSRPESVKQMERIEKRAKEAERLAEINQKKLEELQNKSVEAARNADRHTVKAWSFGIMEKVKTKIPEQYHGLIKQQLDNTLEIARARQSRGEEVSIKWMDKHLSSQVKPIIELINSRSNKQMVNQEVGKAIAGKKQEGLKKIQNLTAQAQPSKTSKRTQLEKELDEDPMKIFDYLDRQISSGRAVLK